MWRFFRPTFAEHDMLFSILLSSNAQPQDTCGQKTPTLEQISVVYHIIFSKTSASLRGALSLHLVQCINIKLFLCRHTDNAHNSQVLTSLCKHCPLKTKCPQKQRNKHSTLPFTQLQYAAKLKTTKLRFRCKNGHVTNKLSRI